MTEEHDREESDRARAESDHERRKSDCDRRLSDHDRRFSDQDRKIINDQEEVQRSLGRLEGKLDMLISSYNVAIGRCDKCDVRIKLLETETTRVKTFALTGAAIATFLGAERLGRMFHLPF